jgi:hypothetical protein
LFALGVGSATSKGNPYNFFFSFVTIWGWLVHGLGLATPYWPLGWLTLKIFLFIYFSLAFWGLANHLKGIWGCFQPLPFWSWGCPATPFFVKK